MIFSSLPNLVQQRYFQGLCYSDGVNMLDSNAA